MLLGELEGTGTSMSTSVRIYRSTSIARSLHWCPDRASALVLRTSSVADHLYSYIISIHTHHDHLELLIYPLSIPSIQSLIMPNLHATLGIQRATYTKQIFLAFHSRNATHLDPSSMRLLSAEHWYLIRFPSFAIYRE